MPRDFTLGFDDEELREARDNRSSAIHRPMVDPGMEDDDNNWGSSGDDEDWGSAFNLNDNSDPFEGSSFGESSFGGSSFGGNSFGGPSDGFSRQYGMQPNQNMGGMQNPEDKFWGTASDVGKKFFNFIKDFIRSFSTFDNEKRLSMFKHLLLSSLAVVGVSLFGLLALPWSVVSHGVIGGLLGAAIGSMFFMFAVDKSKESPNLDLGAPDFAIPDEPDFIDPDPDPDPDSEFEFVPNTWEFPDEPEEPALVSESYNFANTISENTKDPDEVVADFSKIDANTLTRQFLYEQMLSCLETNKSDFDKEIIFSEDSREFLSFVKFVEVANDLVKGKQKGDDIEVIEVKDKLFYTLLSLSRPGWVTSSKVNTIVEEIINQYAVKEDGATIDGNITGAGWTSGNKIFVKIMKGETALVTVKDVLKIRKDEVLDLKNKMPVVIGIDQEGVPLLVDFSEFHSLLVAGAPRSGKSWAVKAMLGQIMMFSNPNDVQFYCADPKNNTSDFFSIETPHVRRFIAEGSELLELMDNFVNREAKVRSDKLQAMGNYKDIKDLKKDHPEVDMPYIYLVIDEIVTFTQGMNKDNRDVFIKLLRQFATRLPNLGIRLIMVPHLIKNQVIDKTTTSMIKNRFCVRGTAEDIEDALDISKKDFPYKLNYPGDMAVHLDGVTKEGPIFLHSAVISKDNNGYEKFFQFLTNSWLKLRPETFKGSKLERDIRIGNVQPLNYPILRDIVGDEQYEQMLKDAERGKFTHESLYEDDLDSSHSTVSRPARPSRPSSNGNSTEVKRPSRPSRPSTLSRTPTSEDDYLDIDDLDIDDLDSVVLSQEEQDNLLEGINPSHKGKSKIEIDEDFF